MMNKFDGKFYKNYNIDNFEGDEERMERARILFNDLMYRQETMEVESNIVDELIERLISEESGEFYIEDQDIDFEEDIKYLGLELKEIDITLYDEYNDDNKLLITEYWTNKKGYMMQQNYPLSKTIFSAKTEDTRKEILGRIIENNLFNYKEHHIYFEFLNKDDKNLFYTILLEEAISIENYEEAVIYRDLLK